VYQKIYLYNIKIKESNVFIKSDLKNSLDIAKKVLLKHRSELVKYISRHKEFLESLKPVKIEENAPEIVKLMHKVTEFINVGPMAAVAGAFADLILDKLKYYGTKYSIVENGGEITAISNIPIYIAIFAGKSPLSGKIGFKLDPKKDYPFGLGTSSGTFGRGFSFGLADAATVVSVNATIGDAAATYICNKVIGNDIEKSIQAGLEAAEDLENIRGVLIIRGKYAGMVGKLPKLIKISGDINNFFARKYEYNLDQDFIVL